MESKRTRFNTTLEARLIKLLKYQAIEEKRGANDILEELLEEHFKKLKK